MSYYQGKKVLLVGGSEGIGRETAVALAKAGIPLLELPARPYGGGPDDCGQRIDEALCGVRP